MHNTIAAAAAVTTAAAAATVTTTAMVQNIGATYGGVEIRGLGYGIMAPPMVVLSIQQ